MKRLMIALAILLTVQRLAADITINVPRLEQAPALSGGIDSGTWQQCARYFGFRKLENGLSSMYMTRFAVGEHGGYLYLLVRCDHPAGQTVKLRQQEHAKDGKIFRDDSVDLAIALPGKAPGEYYQFSLNSINTRYDAYLVDISWNGKWESAAESDSRGYTLYYKIPFSDFGLEQVPAELKMNIGRTVNGNANEQSVLLHQNNYCFFADMQKAVSLRFTPRSPVLAVDPGPDFEKGKLSFNVRTPVIPENGFVDVVLTLTNHKGKLIARKTTQTRFDSKSAVIEFEPGIPDGEYILRSTLEKAKIRYIPAYYGGGEELCEEARQGKFIPAVYAASECGIKINNRPEIRAKITLGDAGKTLNCSLSMQNINKVPGMEIAFKILSEKKQLLNTLKIVPYQRNTATYSFNCSDLAPRTRYILAAELLLNGKVFLKHEQKFATPPKPEWLAPNPDDPGDTVLAPWTPVKLNGMNVTVWNREYQFSENSPLPVQIISKNEKILNSPARLLTGEKKIRWTLQGAPEKSDTTVRFKWKGTGNRLALTAVTEIYFDGIIRFDVTVPPEDSLKELAVEFPVRKEAATFLHRSPVMFGGIFTTYKMPTRPEYHPIRENIYFLNDDVGLCWFDGMKFDWNLKEQDKAIAVLPGASEVTLRINYIDQDKTYKIPRTFSCGILALPVRPMPAKPLGMRTCYSFHYGEEDAKRYPAWLATVDYPANGNIDLKRGTVEFQVKPAEGFQKNGRDEVFFTASHGDYYHLTISQSAEHGIQVIVYEHMYKTHIRSGIKLKKGEWTHIALTWGDEMKLHINGKAVAGSKHRESMKVFPTILRLGGRNIYADSIRISKRPRTDFCLRGHVTVDQDTLLADNFEKNGYINGRHATIPEKVSEEAECGYLMPDTVLAEDAYGKCIQPMRAKVKSRIEGYAALGIETMIYHAAQYTDEAFAGLYIHDEAAFKSSLGAIRKNGMKAVIYTGNSLSNKDRSWDTYSDLWLIEPRGMPFMSPSHPGDKGYQACPRSDYFKYFVWRIGKLMDQYHVDGIFLDGRMYATCNNAKHGCGIVNFEGRLVPERNMWDGRRKMLSLYHTVKKRGGYAEAHKSGNWDAPVCFYWDLAWEGEQFMSTQRGNRKRIEVCPLEAMRAQMNGRPYGLPSRFTAYNNFPFTPVENCTLAFVHGTSATMTYRFEEVHYLAPYWKAQDSFGADNHNFVPYWAKEPPALQTPDPLVKVSAHVRDNKILLIIANFNEDKTSVSGRIQLNPEVFNYGNLKARDAFSGNPVSMNGNTLMLENLKCYRQAWIIIEGES